MPKMQIRSKQQAVKEDKINHPKHYTFGKIEVIDAIEDRGLGYHLGNAVKYIVRAGRKDPKTLKEDLQKAEWYLKRFIEFQAGNQV